MSQAKVDRYKEEKANRKTIMKKNKMKSMAWKGGFGVLAVMFAVWIGYSGYAYYQEQKPVDNAEVDFESFLSFSTDLSGAEGEGQD